jgi:hypothetical protein
MKRIMGVTVAILIGGCSSPTGPLQVGPQRESLQLVSNSDASIHVALIDSETTGVDGTLCANTSTCLQVGPRDVRVVSYTEITGDESGDRVATVRMGSTVSATADGCQAESQSQKVVLAQGA